MNKEKQEEMRLLKSFVCSLAMRLYGEESVSIKEAFKRAHLVKALPTTSRPAAPQHPPPP